MAKKATGGIGAPANLDTPMGAGAVPSTTSVGSLSQAPGTYDGHKHLGPKGVNGGLPLKTYDDSIKTAIGPVDSVGMTVTPMKRGRG